MAEEVEGGPSPPRLSVVVATYNRADLLRETLTSLAAQTLAPAGFEVLVVNNHSDDHTVVVAEDFSRRYHNFRVLLEVRQGVSAARNRGWQAARGEYVLFLDDDAKASPEWCERILAAFETVGPKPIAVGGRILPWHVSEPPGWFSEDLESRSWGREAGFLNPPRQKYGFSGSNMAIRRDILAKHQGFSLRYGPVGEYFRLGEEAEFFMRLLPVEQLFWYDPAIMVYHLVPHSHLHIHYYFARSYLSGKTVAKLNGSKLLSLDLLIAGLAIMKVFARTITAIFSRNPNKNRIMVKKIREFGYSFGMFVGIVKNGFNGIGAKSELES